MKTTFYILFIALLFVGCRKDDPVVEEDLFEGDSGEFTDSRDNQVYRWVRIGDQIWMAENLAYLPAISQPTESSVTEPKRYVYDYNGSNVNEAKVTNNYDTYGVLYNWPAANADCPSGWHLPTVEEWVELAEYVSSQKGPYFEEYDNWSDVGGHLKSTLGWDFNGNGTDDYGFKGIPGGYYSFVNNSFFEIESYSYWWSSSIHGDYEALARSLVRTSNTLWNIRMNKDNAFSVRCIKD